MGTAFRGTEAAPTFLGNQKVGAASVRRMATWNLMELEKIRCRIDGLCHEVSGQG